MRLVPFLITLLCLVFIAILAERIYSTLEAGRGAPAAVPTTGNTGPAPPSDVGAPITAASPGLPQPADPDRVAGASELENARLATIRSNADRWEFLEEDGKFLDERAARSEFAGVRGRYHIKKALASTIRAQGPPPPESIERIQLKNGHVLWARSATTRDQKLSVELLRGIRTDLPEWEVESRRKSSQQQYLEETRADYEARLKELEGGSHHSLREGVRLALERGRTDDANACFERWLALGGPRHLAGALKEPDRSRIASIVETLPLAPDTQTERTTATKPDPAAPAGAEGPVAIAAKPASPENIADFRERLRTVRKELSPEMSHERQQDLLDRLVEYEWWLQSEGRYQVPDVDELRALEKEIQFLRLDLVKQAGF